MKTRRTIYILAVFAFIAAFLTGCHHHRKDQDYPKRMLEHIDEHVEELQLSDTQNDQYLAIRARLETDLVKQQEDHKAFKASILTIIDREDSSVKDLTAAFRTKSKEIPGVADLYLNYIDEFYEILDDQQKAQVMEEIREKSNHRTFRD